MVACECFGAYGTRSCVVHVVGFWGGPKLEANVRRLNPSATGQRDNFNRKFNLYVLLAVGWPVNVSARTGLDPASSTWWNFGEVPNLRPMSVA